MDYGRSFHTVPYFCAREFPYSRDSHRHHRHHETRRRSSPEIIPRAAAWHSWLDGPDKAGQTDNDIAILKSRVLPPETKTLGLNEDEATKFAVDALRDYRRTRVVALSGQDELDIYPRAEMPFRLFNELDQELFRGVLKANVYLKWSDLTIHRHGATSRPGCKSNRVTIELNKRFLWYRRELHWSRGALLAALIHQMTHAYFLICCVENVQHDLGHGLGFSAVLYQIERKFKPENGRFPSLFTCNLSANSSPTLNAPHEFSRNRDSSSINSAGSSQCFFEIEMEDIPSRGMCSDHYAALQVASSTEISAKDGENKSKSNNP
jgi:hypothetical protein